MVFQQSQRYFLTPLSLWLAEVFVAAVRQRLLEGSVSGPQSHALPPTPFRMLPMVAQKSARLGVCPNCSTEIQPRHILIKYETESGGDEAWTECPGCGEVVHPEQGE